MIQTVIILSEPHWKQLLTSLQKFSAVLPTIPEQKVKELRIDGGAAANNFLCQFQADLLGLNVTRPQVLETTAMGAAFLAGLAVGVWKDQAQIRSLWQEEKTFTPQLFKNEAVEHMKNWNRAVERSKGWIVP